jgi:hypothetical protein
MIASFFFKSLIKPVTFASGRTSIIAIVVSGKIGGGCPCR